MIDSVIIRQENLSDRAEVFNLIKETFSKAECSDGDEHYLVERLRNSNAFIPQLSIVAEYCDKIIGHILFTKVIVGNTTQLALAPLTVSKDYQRQGIGSLLIKEGHKLAIAMKKYDFSIVLGNPSYYKRFGYMPSKSFGIISPFDVPEDFFMAAILQEKYTKLNAVVEYPEEFFCKN